MGSMERVRMRRNEKTQREKQNRRDSKGVVSRVQCVVGSVLLGNGAERKGFGLELLRSE